MRSRRVRRTRYVFIQEPFVRRIARRITISIARIASAMSRHFLLPRRPHILPHTRISNSTGRRRRWVLWNATPRRSRARVVINPIHHICHPDMRPDIIGGNNRRAFPFIHHNSRTINSRPEHLPAQSLRPRSQVRMIAIKKPSALFHIQKNRRACRESFPARGGRGGLRVRKSSRDGIFFVGKLPGSPSLIQKEKTKSLRLHDTTFTNPRIGLFTRRRAQPIACKGK